MTRTDDIKGTPAGGTPDVHMSATPGRGRLSGPRRLTALWCAMALCVFAAGCSDTAAPPASSDAPAATTTDVPAPEADSVDSVFSPADAEAVAEALAAAGWPLGVVTDAQAAAAAWPAEGGSSEDLGRFLLPSPPGKRVVAFGSLHGDGRSDPAPIAGATVVAVPDRSWYGWWDALTGLDINRWGDQLPGNLEAEIGLPPGGQLRVDAQQALRLPGALVATTGADGTAQLAPRPGVRYHLCVLSPGVEGLIAGCEYDFHPDSYYTHSPPDGLTAGAGYDTVMVYFSFGRAYLGAARDDDPDSNWDDDDFYWFQRIAEAVFGLGLAAPPGVPATGSQTESGTATVDFATPESLGRSNLMAFIEDSRIGAWWDAISVVEDRLKIPRAALESSPATLVPLEHDPAEYEWFHGRATLQAGTYLVCWLHGTKITTCAYEEFPADSRTGLRPYYVEIADYLNIIRDYKPPQ